MAITPPGSPRTSSSFLAALQSPPIPSPWVAPIAQKIFDLTKQEIDSSYPFSKEKMREALDLSNHEEILNSDEKALDVFLKQREQINHMTNPQDIESFETFDQDIQLATRVLQHPSNPSPAEQKKKFAALLQRTKVKLAQAKALFDPNHINTRAKTNKVFCYAIALLAISLGVGIGLQSYLFHPEKK